MAKAKKEAKTSQVDRDPVGALDRKLEARRVELANNRARWGPTLTLPGFENAHEMPAAKGRGKGNPDQGLLFP